MASNRICSTTGNLSNWFQKVFRQNCVEGRAWRGRMPLVVRNPDFPHCNMKEHENKYEKLVWGSEKGYTDSNRLV